MKTLAIAWLGGSLALMAGGYANGRWRGTAAMAAGFALFLAGAAAALAVAFLP